MTTENKEEILQQFISELSRSSDHTRESRIPYAKKFLDFAEGTPLSEWNRTLVDSFLDHLIEEGYAAGTCQNIYSIVKRVFDAAKTVHETHRTRLLSEVDTTKPEAVAEILKAISLPPPIWDVGKRAGPRVSSGDVVKPAATLEQIKAMIEVARGPEMAYLMMASVYGLRREELIRIRPEHIDYEKKVIFILTAKGGEQRNQLLVDDVMPILKAYDFHRVYTPSDMSSMFLRIESKAGLVHKEGGGFHELRRLLDTVIVDSCNGLDNLPGEIYAHFFLRWRLSSSMVERYYSRELLDIDAKVLSVHPVLKLWKEVKR